MNRPHLSRRQQVGPHRSQFLRKPSGEYADVPWTEPDDLGYWTQACSVNSCWGMSSEVDYHVPAIGGDTGLNYIEDCSQLWAFRGSREDILKIARGAVVERD